MTAIKELKLGNYVVHEGEICEVRDVSLEGDNILVKLRGLFSGKEYSLNSGLMGDIEEADVIRKCAQIVSKKKKGIEIMDCNNFETINANIDESLFEEADVGDQVTYIRFNNSAKILEVRKDI
jgi:translation elongation factor P/translation initiation factor 5A